MLAGLECNVHRTAWPLVWTFHFHSWSCCPLVRHSLTLNISIFGRGLMKDPHPDFCCPFLHWYLISRPLCYRLQPLKLPQLCSHSLGSRSLNCSKEAALQWARWPWGSPLSFFSLSNQLCTAYRPAYCPRCCPVETKNHHLIHQSSCSWWKNQWWPTLSILYAVLHMDAE